MVGVAGWCVGLLVGLCWTVGCFDCVVGWLVLVFVNIGGLCGWMSGGDWDA